MILIDTSVWIDHMRSQDWHLSHLVNQDEVLGHPLITGELAMEPLKNRALVISDLSDLSLGVVANHDEVLNFINSRQLFGLGLSFIDAHLLASVQLTSGTRLWTRDRRLHEAAFRLSLDFTPQLN